MESHHYWLLAANLLVLGIILVLGSCIRNISENGLARLTQKKD